MDDKSDNYEEESEEYILSQLRETFRDEACELLAEIEAALLELEERPGDRELVDRVFRALHTIKGSGGTCEFTDVSSFAHELESFFDMVRKGKIRVTQEFIALALAARDLIKEMLDARYAGLSIDDRATREVVAEFTELVETGDSPTEGDKAGKA